MLVVNTTSSTLERSKRCLSKESNLVQNMVKTPCLSHHSSYEENC